MAVTPVKEGPARRGKKGTEDFETNRLHPIQVEYTYPLGTRVDMDRALPPDLEDADPEEVLDLLSSPPEYEDRISPLTAQFNQETLTGVNPADLQIKFLRKFCSNLSKVAAEVEVACRVRFGESGVVSFMGLGLDPDTIARLIEMDYDTADNVYSRLMELIEKGFVTPIATTPFHTLLPMYQRDFEIRLLIRMGMEIYWPLLRKYNKAVLKNLGEKYFTMVFWLPEGGYNAKVLQILHEEFTKRCEAEGLAPNHLVLLLDVEQSKEREQDLLMKRWNTLRPAPTTRDIVTILFKERMFSDWVVEGHPSTKKQLDRTIAKVDAVLRDRRIDHVWSHFEPLDTLLSTFKTCQNFEQKIIKLTELKYQPSGPDVFVRRKLLKAFGMEDNEPRRTSLRDGTVWNSLPETEGSMVRFLGYDTMQRGFNTFRVLAPDRPYIQILPENRRKRRIGSQCWKPALWASLNNVHRAIIGEPKTFMGGMLGLIREMLPFRRVPLAMRNIEDFLVAFTRVAWKEHFIHHVCSEADIQVDEMARSILLRDAPADLEAELADEECAVIGAAAHAIFQAHMGLNSAGFAFENLDNRAIYENVVMMSLAVTHAITAYKWREEEDHVQELFDVFSTELLGFESALDRHGIAEEFEISEKIWQRTISSEVPMESDLNVVERAARRVGAKHLRALGFRKHFDRRDEFISTATGHLWTYELEHQNYKWENPVFCGMQEE